MTHFYRRLLHKLVPARVRMIAASKLSWSRPDDARRTFSQIYRKSVWGRGVGRFFSGGGSHDPAVVAPYVDAVRRYLAGLERPLILVDIGCGDFNVGRQLVDVVDQYIACDVVPELIAHHQQNLRFPHVRFQLVDAIRDPLPQGDVACLRQVLQHLNNLQIGRILEKLQAYPHWIVTEHLPPVPFTANMDKRLGAGIRLVANSGVVLTEPPFNVRPRNSRMLCEIAAQEGVIRTVAYEF